MNETDTENSVGNTDLAVMGPMAEVAADGTSFYDFSWGPPTGADSPIGADWVASHLMLLTDELLIQANRHGHVRNMRLNVTDCYPEAVDLAFSPYAEYGVLIKEYRNADMGGRSAPGEIVNTERRVIKGTFDERAICTSHIERHNLTVRTFMKRFARLSLGFSKKFECLAAAVGLFMAYYNFVWRTRYPDERGKAGRRRPPAAMLAGLTDHWWSFSEFYETILQYC